MNIEAKSAHDTDQNKYESPIRASFWLLAIVIGGINAYSSRFFINNDAIAYIEIGEAIKQFNWSDSANFTFSPLYSLLFVIFQSALQLNPFNEIIWAKGLNLLIFLATCGSLEIFLRFLKREHTAITNAGEMPIAWVWIQTILYSTFLVTSVVSVRLRLINPDMLVFCLILLTLSVLLWIREKPTPHFKFIVLGILLGLGYLAKAFMFLLSPFFLILAAFSVGALRKSITRVAVAVLCFLLIIGPLLTILYLKKGSFSYGEGGRHVYAKLIGGQGVPDHPGKVLQEEPRIVIYDYNSSSTRPFTFDVTYWTIGIEPKHDNGAHIGLFLRNLMEIPEQSHWLWAILVWALFQICIGTFVIGRIFPVSPQILLLLTAIAGIFLFAMISMEPRYVAPFLFAGTAGLVFGIRLGQVWKVFRRFGTNELLSLALVILLLGSVLECSFDEAGRGLSFQDGKHSYQRAYREETRVGYFLNKHGIVSGNHVAVVGSPPIQWARMAGVRVIGEIEDYEKFLDASTADRLVYLGLLRNEGIAAVIARGTEWQKLAGEGWLQVPGTDTYWALLL